MTTAELRAAAADLIETKGWTRGKYIVSGRLCMVAALCRAAGHEPNWTTVNQPLVVTEAFIELCEEVGTEDLIDWNDTRKRRTEVIAALRGQQS